MYQEFNAHGITVPLEIERNLELLHSYVIVRMHIRNGRHLNAARLLIRVAQSISKFPARKHRSLQSPKHFIVSNNLHKASTCPQQTK